ncbi:MULTISPECIES: nucleoside-diphosphate sugar epimerase/dehydratase [unclassified Fibrobacter]|uniref:polysaccharide biosynthesis protein n=1 Tax=unclassified Fibrobacter TaxID=2634177 RepID=UPI0009241C19|nr:MULTISPECIES: nucleoside-diphosphate sugar epimerase/dehydratase [unclassified Fibrobacter]SHK68252.1 NDP-sugar epimerase, includes UDP-GlcNAc-inverting 4,6-dehydratase FlaA1 and capsular polysaccharide biosynthesis protein EpsC [Fibrobacter sp. UWB12]SIO04216.1 NDP-sugar epimerase, includes UDP-GlcNAc-inverting 4,6-dehydratase FlaA1 and capsular polysaccharide biosynthesis protein EpsC [Fibrobacter sp. UWB11]
MSKIMGLFSNFRVRKRVLALADAFIVVVAGLFANFPLPLYAKAIDRADQFAIFFLSVILCFSALLFYGAYNKLWRYLNRYDYLSCIKGIFSGLVATHFFFYLVRGELYWEFALVQALIASLGVCFFRYMFRNAFISLVEFGHRDALKKRTMIIGAGNATKLLLNEIRNSSDEAEKGLATSSASQINPVCLIDDDRYKIGKPFEGVLVAGGTSEIPKIAKQENIEQILFSIPSCPPKDRQVIMDLCGKTGLPVKVLPFVGSLLQPANEGEATNFVTQIRDIKVEDLLGREPIKFDNKDILAYIENKVCMVTGGGGSIGSELVRQIAKYKPKQIIIVDIYENNAYDIQQELLMEYGTSLNLVTLIASVRDYFRLSKIYKTYHPDVVFHAAAHKHVPLMENNPMEAIKNNVVGTFNVATLAMFNNVKKFVMISTDKAVNPTNVMGASKRCCEMIVRFMSMQKDSNTEFVVTRFGNVLGSNGSVIPLFKRQIEQGKPVTVTHPEIIRYFMTIPEAVSLVLEAASIAHGGEIFVLDMGMPVKIVTLAENLIRMYGKVPYKDVPIKFTGLRPGEKIKEELLMNEEGLKKTKNKLIFIGKQIDIDTSKFINELWKLKCAASENNDEIAIRALHEIVPTFTTPEQFNSTVLKGA